LVRPKDCILKTDILLAEARLHEHWCHQSGSILAEGDEQKDRPTLELLHIQLKHKNHFNLHGLSTLLRGPILLFISFY